MEFAMNYLWKKVLQDNYILREKKNHAIDARQKDPPNFYLYFFILQKVKILLR